MSQNSHKNKKKLLGLAILLISLFLSGFFKNPENAQSNPNFQVVTPIQFKVGEIREFQGRVLVFNGTTWIDPKTFSFSETSSDSSSTSSLSFSSPPQPTPLPTPSVILEKTQFDPKVGSFVARKGEEIVIDSSGDSLGLIHQTLLTWPENEQKPSLKIKLQDGIRLENLNPPPEVIDFKKDGNAFVGFFKNPEGCYEVTVSPLDSNFRVEVTNIDSFDFRWESVKDLPVEGKFYGNGAGVLIKESAFPTKASYFYILYKGEIPIAVVKIGWQEGENPQFIVQGDLGGIITLSEFKKTGENLWQAQLTTPDGKKWEVNVHGRKIEGYDGLFNVNPLN